MPHETSVATKTTVATKVAVATLMLAGLAALGYASGYVKLDYQSGKATADAAAKQCDCLFQCVEARKACTDAGRPIEECNGDLGACVDLCAPTNDSATQPTGDQPTGDQPKGNGQQTTNGTKELNSCELTCKDSFEGCLAAGNTNDQCIGEATACMCECDPTFAPEGQSSQCVDQCTIDERTCEEANAANQDPSLNVDCKAQTEECVKKCDTLWCDEFRASNLNQTGQGNPNELGNTTQ